MDQVSADKIVELTDVSRETLARLAQYEALLQQWNPKINLVAKSTLSQVWQRHILDSAQIFPHIPQDTKLLTDIGSGAGFPGLVLAVLAKEKIPDLSITLVESDQRKCAFLRAVARELSLSVNILTTRIEQAELAQADILTARALAPIADLLTFQENLLHPDGVCLFLKGANYATEILKAKESFDFAVESIKSRTDPNGVILRISGVSRVTS